MPFVFHPLGVIILIPGMMGTVQNPSMGWWCLYRYSAVVYLGCSVLANLHQSVSSMFGYVILSRLPLLHFFLRWSSPGHLFSLLPSVFILHLDCDVHCADMCVCVHARLWCSLCMYVCVFTWLWCVHTEKMRRPHMPGLTATHGSSSYCCHTVAILGPYAAYWMTMYIHRYLVLCQTRWLQHR